MTTVTGKLAHVEKKRKCISFCLSVVLSSAPVNGEQDHDHGSEHADLEEIIVQSTRSGRRILDGALRVEAFSGEEIEEKLLMRPGNISMMLNETGGLRVQVHISRIGIRERKSTRNAWPLHTAARRWFAIIWRTSFVAWTTSSTA